MQTSETSSTTPTRSETLEKLTMALGMSDLRLLYKEKPITFHKTYRGKKPMAWPLVIRNAYALIWSGKYPRIIMKAPRGGGKSKLLGTVGFDEWFFKDRSVINMGGSQVQADVVYGYFSDYCDVVPNVKTYVKGNITASETIGARAENTFGSVTASQKQVRGKHPDILLSDETCETADELILAALPMVNDSKHPLVIMASTFHKIYGIFQETWDDAEQRGYLRIQWDIFDVVRSFDPNIWESPEYEATKDLDQLKALAKGRTGDPEGWIPIENVIQAWREKPTLDWFLVEYMGSRPSAAGLVLKPEDVDASEYDTDARYDNTPGVDKVLGIDWGFSTMTAVVEAQACVDSVISLLDVRTYHQTKAEDIIVEVVEIVRRDGIRFIYADSAGKFENAALQSALIKAGLPCTVVEVVFSVEKEGMISNLRAHFEQHKIKIPKRFKPRADGRERTSKEAYWQFKRYRYQPGTDKVVKKDDHIPDATQCALQHFPLNRIVRHLPQQEETQKPKTPEPERMNTSRPITSDLRNKTF